MKWFLILGLMAPNLFATEECDVFLNETMAPRYELRRQQYEGLDPVVRAFAESLKSKDLQIPEKYRRELQKSRFGAYVNQPVSRKTGVRSGKPLNLSPDYFPEIPRATRDEIFNSGLFHYMKESGNGNSHFKALVEANIHKATHYLFRLETNEETAFSLIPTPVGSYPPEFYRKLMITTGILLSLTMDAYEDIRPSLDFADAAEFGFARKELEAHAQGEVRGGTKDKPAFFAFQEGIVSLHQLLVLLTIDQVKGVSGDELVRALLTARSERGDTLASVYSRMIPMGLMGPMILRGDLFENPVLLNSDGQVVPTVPFRDFLLEAKAKLLERIKRLPYVTRGTCRGCPMVHSSDVDKASGIDVLAEIYLNIFNQVLKIEDQ